MIQTFFECSFLCVFFFFFWTLSLSSPHGVINRCVLLAPSADRLARFKRMLARAAPGGGGGGGGGGERTTERVAAFGFDRCNSMMDEQSIAHFLNDECPPAEIGDARSAWTMIHQRFNLIPWHPQWLRDADDAARVEQQQQQQRKRGRGSERSGGGGSSGAFGAAASIATPTLFHYFNVNPWEMRRAKYADLESWWNVAKRLTAAAPALAVWFHSADLAAPLAPPRTCFWCTAVLKHDAARSGCRGVWAEDGTLACPLLRGDLRGSGGGSGGGGGSEAKRRRVAGGDSM